MKTRFAIDSQIIFLNLLLSCLASIVPGKVLAQSVPVPMQNPVSQPIATPQPLPSIELPVLSVPKAQTTPAASASIAVRKIEVVGSTMFQPRDWEEITKSVEGRTISLEELHGIAEAITQLYLNRGYLTSRAIVGDQEIKQGMVQIRVIEGSIAAIDVQGLTRLKPAYVRNRLQLGAKTPLNKTQLEDQLRLLKADPLFETVEASLRPGRGVGQSILTVRIQEAKAIDGTVGIDNDSPPSIGSERLSASLSYRNLTGIGDELSVLYARSLQGGSNLFDFNYRAPLNPMNGAIQLRIAPSNSKIITADLIDFGIRSNTTLYEIHYRQPLVRSIRQEFALSLGFVLQNGQTFLFNDTPFPFGIGPDGKGNSRTRVLKFGQDYLKRDIHGAWILRSQLNLGLNVLGATLNADPVPDGRFFSWLAQAQRIQRLSADHLFIVAADLQLSPNRLLPSQQFAIGGGQSLRGYRQNARSGDNGFRVSIEDRIALQRGSFGAPTLQVAPFVDLGAVWNQSNNPNKLTNETFLVAAGFGLLWEPVPQLFIRLNYGVPIVTLTDKGNNVQDQGFTFGVGYRF